MTKFPQTTWEYSLKTEAKRLLFTAHQIAVGFYHANDFLVLPDLPKKSQGNVVIFPALDHYALNKFWKTVKLFDVDHFPLTSQPALAKDMQVLISKASLPKLNYQKMQKLWDRSQKEILSHIEQLIFPSKTLIKSLTIYPTNFGSITSFSISKHFPAAVYVYLRQDANLFHLVEALLTSLTRNLVYTKLKGSWEESELLVDWLLTQSSLRKVIEKFDKSSYAPTITTTRNLQIARLQQQSQAYLESLGISFEKNIFSVKGNLIFANHKSLLHLSQKEKAILEMLIQKQERIVSFDELGDLIFKDAEKFSLYAIAKTIQRLREKLETNSISGTFVQTHRGQGYMLKS